MDEELDGFHVQLKKVETQLDKLVRGQARIEHGIERIREERVLISTGTEQSQSNMKDPMQPQSSGIYVLSAPDTPSRAAFSSTRMAAAAAAATSTMGVFSLERDEDGGDGGTPNHDLYQQGGGSDSFTRLSNRTSGDLMSPSLRVASIGGGSTNGRMNFKAHDAWCMPKTRSRLNTGRQAAESDAEGAVALSAQTWVDQKQGFLPLHPTSWVRVAFDIVGFGVLIYDASVVPYYLAWEVPIEGTMWLISCIAVMFWMVDLGLNMVTGYIQDGHLIMSSKAVALHYLKGGFLLDLALIIMESVGLVFARIAADSVSGSEILVLRSARLAKISRAVRIMAKLRTGLALKTEQVMTVLMSTTGLSGQMQVVQFLGFAGKLVFFIGWLHHAGSCLWYWLQTTIESDTGRSWLDDFTRRVGDSDDWQIYLHGVYWSVTAMFSGACVAPPSNTFEAIFAEIYIVSSGLFVTLIGSSLAAKLIQSQLQHQERTKRYRLLNLYLRQQQVDPILAIAARAQFRDRMGAKRMLSEIDMPFLSVLSAPLRADLRYARCGHFLSPNSLLRACDMVQSGIVRELCFHATSQALVSVGEEVFSSRTVIEHTLYVLQGHLNYLPDNMSEGSQVTVGQPISENALFLKWRALGALYADREASISCEILRVGTEAFQNVFRSYDDLHSLAQAFAAKLAEVMRYKDPDDLTDLDAGVDYDEVLAMIGKDSRMWLSNEAQEQGLPLRGGPNMKLLNFGITHLDDWDAAVLDGQALLQKSVSGELYGVARVVTLRLRNRGSLCCLLLGSWRPGGKAVTTMSLPSRVVAENGTFEASMQLLLEELGTLGSSCRLEVSFVHSRVEETPGTHNTLASKLIRMIQECEVDLSSPEASKKESMGAGSLQLPVTTATTNSGGTSSSPDTRERKYALPWSIHRSSRSEVPTADHVVITRRSVCSSSSDPPAEADEHVIFNLAPAQLPPPANDISAEPMSPPVPKSPITPGMADSLAGSNSLRAYNRLRKRGHRQPRPCGAFLVKAPEDPSQSVNIYGWVPESELEGMCSVHASRQLWSEVSHWLHTLHPSEVKELPILALSSSTSRQQVQLADPPFAAEARWASGAAPSEGNGGGSLPTPQPIRFEVSTEAASSLDLAALSGEG
eukprot:CAMPEP_0178377908 /NCGR_PEP_ID=MMETSP0689_2-20121128/4157_1 /TAXON_ID=160604 /ORGANISM="Amphidinium massartii, Strain CS-259" /LENGTH=1136 /DNA_ID=CAMNT_0019997969 /DNA_START=56 /DNA_END=3463 /DNA_ORIENTATION=+